MSQKISAMTPAGALNGTEQLPVIRGGPPNLRTTTAAIAALGGGIANLVCISSGDAVTVGSVSTISLASGSGLHFSSTGAHLLTITLADATAAAPGEVSTGSQTFGGIKAFKQSNSLNSYLIADGGLSGFGVWGWEDPVDAPGCFSGWHLGAREADLELSDATFTALLRVIMSTGHLKFDLGNGGIYRTSGSDGATGTGGAGDTVKGGIITALGSPPPPPPSATSITFTAPGDSVTVPNTLFVQVAAGSGLHLSTPGTSSVTLTMADATGTTPGEVSTGNQTFAGQKMFLATGISSVGLNVVGGPTSQAGTFFGASSTPASPQSGISYSANTVQMEVFLAGGSRFSRLTSSAGVTHFELSGTATDTFAFAVPAGPGGYGTGSGGDSFAGGLWMSAGTPPPASITIGSSVAGSTAYNVLVVSNTFTLAEVAPSSTVGWVMTSNGTGAMPSFQAPASTTLTIGQTVGGSPTANLPLYVNASSQLEQLTLSMSVIISSANLQLDGDQATPSAGNYYGTNSFGTKGWWSLPATLVNPMTTTGDMIYSVDNSGTPGRLPIGSNATIMYVNSGIPGWTNTGITVNNATPSLSVSGGGGGATLSGGSGGNVVSSDGTRQILLTDGTYAANATSGSFNALGTSNNTYRWNNSSSAPPTQSVGSTPADYFGAGPINSICGTPDGWILVNVGGTDVKIPVYFP